MKTKTNERQWHRLDNAGKLYPSIVSPRVSTVLRLSATLNMDVDPEILQRTLEITLPKFRHFQVRLRKGLFWYYFEEVTTVPKVQKETYYPCMYLDFRKKDILPFRVIYYRKRISFEVSHSLTDGYGAVVFMQSLLLNYLHLTGNLDESTDLDMFSEYTDTEEVYEDAFHKYYNDKVREPRKPSKAYHLPFNLNAKGEYFIITGIVPADDLYKLAKSYNTSVTKFLLAVYFETFLDFLKTTGSETNRRNLPVTMNMPVNLRTLFPSKTLKNFFVSLTPSIDTSLGDYSFDEILKYIEHYFGMRLNTKYIQKFISRNVANEKKWKVRLLPLPIKNLAIPFIYSRFGETNYTSSLSNLGVIKMPEEIRKHVDQMDIYPPPSVGNLIKITMLSYNNKTCISFGSLTPNREIEKLFFRKLRKMNLHVKIETNTKLKPSNEKEGK
ncbi:hypothetical protein SAMN02745751_00388 [Dethiosulfatibacter aminovorans DSM 17477]|uniref:Alcohol acetyltransferase n=1 Tax=Dethiosulfatibacter aminovorans DSM 17477 TaxID=1121476 RepID=A0A1M6BKC6_9FIRM|nr:hypothetical protein [Dethiosulfatibacter aminovorans]SHI49175.1 hypothetical protein SAMN02745751_00388 [Dethiosulfatibacter aminovorans DSM 17477]